MTENLINLKDDAGICLDFEPYLVAKTSLLNLFKAKRDQFVSI
jgi:hypothetical protein